MSIEANPEVFYMARRLKKIMAENPIYKCPRCGLEQLLLQEGTRIRELEQQLKIEKDLRLNAEQDLETAKDKIEQMKKASR